jgi:hypothetical protein
MKGTNAGECEELVLLTVVALVMARSMRDKLWDRMPAFAWKKV